MSGMLADWLSWPYSDWNNYISSIYFSSTIELDWPVTRKVMYQTFKDSGLENLNLFHSRSGLSKLVVKQF